MWWYFFKSDSIRLWVSMILRWWEHETEPLLGPNNIIGFPIMQRSWVYTMQIILEGSLGPHSPGITERFLVQGAVAPEPGSSARSLPLAALCSLLWAWAPGPGLTSQTALSTIFLGAPVISERGEGAGHESFLPLWSSGTFTASEATLHLLPIPLGFQSPQTFLFCLPFSDTTYMSSISLGMVRSNHEIQRNQFNKFTLNKFLWSLGPNPARLNWGMIGVLPLSLGYMRTRHPSDIGRASHLWSIVVIINISTVPGLLVPYN